MGPGFAAKKFSVTSQRPVADRPGPGVDDVRA